MKTCMISLFFIVIMMIVWSR